MERRVLGPRLLGLRRHARHLGKRSSGIRETIVQRHYTTTWRINKHRKIDFLGESLLWRKRNWVEGVYSTPLEVAERRNGDGDGESALGRLFAALEGIHEHFHSLAGIGRDENRGGKQAIL